MHDDIVALVTDLDVAHDYLSFPGHLCIWPNTEQVACERG